VSKVTGVEYGEVHSSLPVRTWRSTSIMAATNRLPQMAGAEITYVGSLASAQWLSVVDVSQNSNNRVWLEPRQHMLQVGHTQGRCKLQEAPR
jgi:hypothetical protein